MTDGPQVVSVVAPPAGGWTIETYAIHNEALRAAKERFDDERDRRYTEVGVEREKALKIKETADLAALGLAREIQTYKDEKANELRSQIERERVTYVTQNDLAGAIARIEAVLTPVADWVKAQQGRGESLIENRSRNQWSIQTVLTVVGFALAGLYFILNYRPPV